VSTLKKILGAMGTTMGEFFSVGERRDDGTRVVFRAGELVKAAPGKGLRCLALPPASTTRALQLLHETWGPGSDTGSEPYTHEGEEGGFCLSGSVEITVAGRRELLGPGDAYYYSSKLPHRWRNVGRTPAVVISACTPPTF
jgi:mannose-6-phosphate isomerase-like protein (cupin superfamily)